MAGPLLLIPAGYWIAGGIAGALGWTAYKSGNAIAQDIDALGDVAVSAAAGLAASKITGKPMIGLAAGAVTYAAMTRRQRE